MLATASVCIHVLTQVFILLTLNVGPAWCGGTYGTSWYHRQKGTPRRKGLFNWEGAMILKFSRSVIGLSGVGR